MAVAKQAGARRDCGLGVFVLHLTTAPWRIPRSTEQLLEREGMKDVWANSHDACNSPAQYILARCTGTAFCRDSYILHHCLATALLCQASCPISSAHTLHLSTFPCCALQRSLLTPFTTWRSAAHIDTRATQRPLPLIGDAGFFDIHKQRLPGWMHATN